MSFRKGKVLVVAMSTSACLFYGSNEAFAASAASRELSFFEYLGSMVEKESGVYLDPLHL